MEKIKKIFKNKWVKLFIKLCSIGLIIFLVLQYVFGVHIYYGNNMSPMLNDGTLILTYKIDKGFYGNEVVRYEHNNNYYYGRIIGVPGDIITINETGHVNINGNIIIENIFYNTFPAEDKIQYPYKVNEGEYFIMNDYRDNLNDSRSFGNISIDDIEGQICIEIIRRGF